VPAAAVVRCARSAAKSRIPLRKGCLDEQQIGVLSELDDGHTFAGVSAASVTYEIL